jgi:hypothetical protein
VVEFSNHHQEVVVKKRILFGLVIFLAIWILGACSAESEPEPGDFKSYSRCDLFADGELSVVLYGIYPGDTTVKMYVKFGNGKVIGLEDGRDDGLSWDYSVKIGEVESFGCDVFEGETFAGRLYCVLPLPPEYRNAARPAVVRVNGCNRDLLSIPQLSLLVEKPAAGSAETGGVAGSSSSGKSGSSHVALPANLNVICGSRPTALGVYCSAKIEEWCNCMGGEYSCNHFTNMVQDVCDLP